MPDPAPTPEPPLPPRTLRALILSLALLALPVAGVHIGARLFHTETIPRSDLTTAFFIGAILCVAAWLIFPTINAARTLARSAGARHSARTSLTSPTLNSPHLIRSVLADHDLPCPRCNYNLRGLTDTACPECHAPITIRVSTAPAIGPTPLLVCAAAAAFVFMGAVYVVQLSPLMLRLFNYGARGAFGAAWGNVVPISLFVALALVGTILLALFTIRWLRAPDADARAASRWRLLRTSIVLLAIDGALTLAWTIWMFFRW